MAIRIGTHPNFWSALCPSEGLMDYREVFGQCAGCDEWIVIEAEQDPKRAPPLGYGAFGIPHLRHALSTVDLS